MVNNIGLPGLLLLLGGGLNPAPYVLLGLYTVGSIVLGVN